MLCVDCADGVLFDIVKALRDVLGDKLVSIHSKYEPHPLPRLPAISLVA